jgi:hypothetical protein
MNRVTALFFLLLITISSFARSDDSKSELRSDAFAVITDANPMKLARVVDRLGDNAVLARLGKDNPVEIRLAAVRASRWMRAPERALATLARLVSSRDSELAPAAARAAWYIASELNDDVLAEREVVPGVLSAVRNAFDRAADNAVLRADIKLLAAQTAEALVQPV